MGSDKEYKQEYEEDKAMIYYPAHISEEYEAQKKVKEATADVNYKAEFEATKTKNAFQVDQTETYQVMKENEDVAPINYKADYEHTKAQNTPLAESNEMK